MGDENDANYTRLEVLFLPCNYRHTMLGYQDEPMHPECNKSLEDQRKYLGAVHFQYMFNIERFNPEGYGDEKFDRFSKIVNKQFDEKAPNWINSSFQITEIQDETEMFQLGFEEEDQISNIIID